MAILEALYYKLLTLGQNPWLSVHPLSWVSIWACILSGGIIGLERQWMGKPIGIRTSVLIVLGTYIFVRIGLFSATGATDPTRIVGQVITGIGFLGAGVMLTRDGMVVGATSAACIWVLAAVGVVISLGEPFLGAKLSLITVALLLGLNVVEEKCGWLQHGMHTRVPERIEPIPAEPARDSEERPDA